MLLCAGAILVLALALPGNIPREPYSPSLAGEKTLNGSGQIAVMGHLTGHTGTMTGNNSALFSKNVTAGTRYIIVSLYSGDITDPISVTVIAPDRTLGPFYDESDGIVDGRIDLKISNPDQVTPGTWKFLIHSNKNIATGSLENLSWIRTATDNHKDDE